MMAVSVVAQHVLEEAYMRHYGMLALYVPEPADLWIHPEASDILEKRCEQSTVA